MEARKEKMTRLMTENRERERERDGETRYLEKRFGKAQILSCGALPQGLDTTGASQRAAGGQSPEGIWHMAHAECREYVRHHVLVSVRMLHS